MNIVIYINIVDVDGKTAFERIVDIKFVDKRVVDTYISYTHFVFFHILFCSKKFVAYDCFVFNYSAILNMNLNIYENIYYVRIYNVKTYINIY